MIDLNSLEKRLNAKCFFLNEVLIKRKPTNRKCLLPEIITDLNSLEERLNAECFELGIDQEKANE